MTEIVERLQRKLHYVGYVQCRSRREPYFKCQTLCKMPCYREGDRTMRPVYRLFRPNFAHAYVHYFARFWTNLSRSHSAHWSNDRVLILNVANNCVANSTQRHVPIINTPRSTSAAVCTYCTWRPLSDGTPANIRVYFIFLATRIRGVHFAADSTDLSSLKLLRRAP